MPDQAPNIEFGRGRLVYDKERQTIVSRPKMDGALNENERQFFNHMGRWGSDGYPVMKSGRKWIWVEFYGIKGAPVLYRTKREAFQAIENYLDMLADKAAGRAA